MDWFVFGNSSNRFDTERSFVTRPSVDTLGFRSFLNTPMKRGLLASPFSISPMRFGADSFPSPLSITNKAVIAGRCMLVGLPDKSVRIILAGCRFQCLNPERVLASEDTGSHFNFPEADPQ